MRLVTYRIGENEKVGILTPEGDSLYPMEVFDLNFKTMLELIDNITADQKKMIQEKMSSGILDAIPLKKVKLLAPIPQPRQDLICMGVNYFEHVHEVNEFVDDGNFKSQDPAIYFSKRVNEAVAPGDYIDSHSDIVKDLDYEAELAVIIGKKARNVKAKDVADYVFGYTIVNDVSARTIQSKHKQWYFGKSLDGFTPMGPILVTADEFAFPPKLKLQCKVNGELRQNTTTDRMIHTISEAIEELSQGITLLPGTIISTGTPSGVGIAYNPPKILRSGDIVECIIEGIGNLSNQVK
ncbi:fumarylacetoacetate hydrolase family protein [Clostridium sp. MB40-C1]|uniref:fumarylacetoacetate hydrolase family protein n=1 Tax=Clostridium sp. MB40-C1 TaxID=3070996 RepID=UPI0027E00A03|nr:fumarylacetoacetate hydrolase family protein [Clostridium sp. MB40-C1]WMJ81626.1 fumarylacetoacetate hydrolase family protein [Clostridium sp. MB40-C1]